MSDIDKKTERKERKVSQLARWAFRLAVINTVLFSVAWLIEQVPTPKTANWLVGSIRVFMDLTFVWLVLAVPAACLMSWISLVIISGSRGRVSGVWRALGSGAICLTIGSVAFLELRAAVADRGCSENIRGIAIGMYVYASENDHRLPPAENWCDILIESCEISPHGFRCFSSDARLGESSYAINASVDGENVDSIPGDVVLVFETDYGKVAGDRDGQLRDRRFYKTLEWDKKEQTKEYKGSQKVYSKRWNQSGGPEIATTEHHSDKQMHVVFCDSTVRQVKGEDIGKLRWTVEEPNE